MAYEMFIYNTWPMAIVATCAVTVLFWYLCARTIEFLKCRARLQKVFTVTSSTSLLQYIVTVVYSGLDVSLTMADLIDSMSATRSRRYVLYLAVKSIRQAPVRELALRILHMNKQRRYASTFLQRLVATFTVADI